MVGAEATRSLLGRFPTGVCVVTVDAEGQKLGLTLASAQEERGRVYRITEPASA